MLIYSSPQLIAVNRVLLRLLMPRHSPYALVRLNFLCCSLSELYEFHLNIWLLIREKTDAFASSFCFESFFHPKISLLGEIVVNYPFGKTLNSIDLVNLMSSVSVRFNSFLFLYSIFNEHKSLAGAGTAGWSVWMDSNHRPHAYQACALTT